MGMYTKGLKTGHWKIFSEYGQLKEEGEYMNDKKYGEWKTYDIKGNFLKNIKY
jgi:antitoxin component YwqK of YwqJK toxin-antitoxin module